MAFDDGSELRAALQRELQLFEMLEQLRKLATKMRMALAHDIKSPLAVMMGVTDLLTSQPGRLTEERSTKLLAALRSSLDQIHSLVSEAVEGEWSDLLTPITVDLAQVAGRAGAGVAIEGSETISTYYPELVEALMVRRLASAKSLHLSREEEWAILRISGGSGGGAPITDHFIQMLGGETDGTDVRLPIQPALPRESA